MSTETKTYNGWTNYETWNVALWIDNEEGSYGFWNEQAQECWDQTREEDDKETRGDYAVSTLANRLEDHFRDASQELLDNANAGSSVWADLLGAALSEVNWREIAVGRMESVDKGEEEESD